MKKIEATVRISKVDDICAALEKADYPDFVTIEIESHGKQQGTKVRDRTYRVGLKTMTRIEVMVKDDDAERIVNTIRETALSGETDDGKILVWSVDNMKVANN